MICALLMGLGVEIAACSLYDGVQDADGDADGGQACGASQCAAGEVCAGTTCATACTSREDCPSDMHCSEAGACVPNVPPSCEGGGDCPDGQTCLAGVCGLTGGDDCIPALPRFADDPCTDYDVCGNLADPEGMAFACETMPPCGDEFACPSGTLGAVCSAGVLVDRPHICLIGYCLEDTDCPTDHKCATPQDFAVGKCTDGKDGSLCAANSDCDGSCIGVSGSFQVCVGGG